MTKYMITGAKLQSKANSKEYEDNYDNIFGVRCPKCNLKQTDKNNVLCQSCGELISSGRS